MKPSDKVKCRFVASQQNDTVGLTAFPCRPFRLTLSLVGTSLSFSQDMLRRTYSLLTLWFCVANISAQSFLPDVIWSKGVHAGQVQAIALSPDETTAASASSSGSIKLWRFNDASLLKTLTGHSNYVNAISFSPDGQYLLSGGSDGTARTWRVSTGELLRVWTEAEPVTSVSVSPDGQFVAASTASPFYPHPLDAVVRIWNL